MQKLCEGDTLVSVIDERGELMACEAGSLPRAAQIRCDVYARCTKAEGIAMALRCMNPQVIVCDELGTPGDAEAVAQVLLQKPRSCPGAPVPVRWRSG